MTIVSLGASTRGWPFSRELLANLREFRRTQRNGGCATECGRDRTDDSRLPWSASGRFGRYGGWGGHAYHGTAPGTTSDRTPVVFVHGNQRDACDWDAHAEFFLRRGYLGDELWAVTFADGSPTHASMAATIEHFVGQVREETGAEQVSVVAHSLGVTGLRYWMDEYDRLGWVDTLVGLAGANHGTVLSAMCADAGMTDGPYKMSPFLRADYESLDDHPLTRLNEDETPGAVDYFTLRGTEDPLFWRCPDSPRLEGAENVALGTDHDGVRVDREAMELVFEWVSGTDPDDLRHHVGLPDGREVASD